MSLTRPGAKLGCAACGTQLVVVRPPADVPSCCGQALDPVEKSGTGAGVSRAQ